MAARTRPRIARFRTRLLVATVALLVARGPGTVNGEPVLERKIHIRRLAPRVRLNGCRRVLCSELAVIIIFGIAETIFLDGSLGSEVLSPDTNTFLGLGARLAALDE